MSLRRVDVTNDDDFNAWFALYSRCERLGWPLDEPGWQPGEIRVRAGEEGYGWVMHLFSYPASGPTLAVGTVELSSQDNRHLAMATLFVVPEERRRGHGTAALAALERYAGDHGVTDLLVLAVETSGELGSGPSRTFAPQRGYALDGEQARRAITWPRPAGELDDLAAMWLPHAKEYEILGWTRAAPDAWLAECARLQARMSLDGYYGDVPVAEEVWTPARIREKEAQVAEMGRELFVAAARHVGTNTLCGFTELTVPLACPASAWQWATLVLTEHRGHRLGGLLKLANLAALARSNLAVKRILTYNAVKNAPMIRVNDALGAVVDGGEAIWAKRL